jgi:hypothetical protein
VVEVQLGERRHRDEFNPNSARRRRGFLVDAKDELGLGPDEVADLDCELLAKADELLGAPDAQEGRAPVGLEAIEPPDASLMEEARRFLANPDIIDELLADIARLGVAGDEPLALALYLVGTSRLLEKPLAAIVLSPSGTGKSHVTDTVFSLIPPEQRLKGTHITDSAWYTMEPGSLRRKLVYVAERLQSNNPQDAKMANATRALRELLSSGEVQKFVTRGSKTITIAQTGEFAYLETGTQEEIFDENQSRLLPLHTDESPEQTRRILELQAKQAAGQLGSPEEKDRIRQKHHAAQRLLVPLQVDIPYAEAILLRAGAVRARRAFPQVIGCIKAVALLRQFQKTVTDGVIEADLTDYEIALLVLEPILLRIFAPIPGPAQDVYKAILARHVGDDGTPDTATEFTRNEVIRWTGLGMTTVRKRLNQLTEAGLVRQTSGGGRGRECRYYLAKDTRQATSEYERLLPTPAELAQAVGDNPSSPSTAVNGSAS